MVYKPKTKTATFSELEMADSQFMNKTLSVLNTINATVSWDTIEDRLIQHYPVGKKKAGSPAYPPLVLFKALLLKQWFAIKSDTDLQSQINDRLSFKRFLGFSITDSSPASITFARFRSRLTREVLTGVTTDLTDQLSGNGLSITLGSAADPRLGAFLPIH
ncbi:MAG: transposase [Pseudomonadota bacterium]